MRPIKMVDLHRQYLIIKQEIDQAIQSVLDSSEFIMGALVSEFEHELSQYLGVKFVIGCASGTDALLIAMMALEIGPGDEVITSPFSFAATAEAIALLGAQPVYADIDSRTYNINSNLISDCITQKTKAIVPVHLFGQSADMGPILSLAKENDLKVIEDSAQSIGARYHNHFVGTLGDIGCLSFYPTKNLGAYGDAGAILTNDSSLAQKCRLITEHGSRVKYHHETLGINSRLDSLQAAVLKVKLKHLESWTEARIGIAQRYSQALSGLDLITPYRATYAKHVYHQYCVRTPRRAELAAFLKGRGLPYSIHYPVPLHEQPAFRKFVEPGICFPVAETVAKQILSLPIFPELEDREIDSMTSSLRQFFETAS